MNTPIQRLQAIQIIREIKTKGSSPILILAEDDQEYYVKVSSKEPPKIELINEVICSYFLKCWQIHSPEIALITIGEDILDAYVKEKGPLSKRYNSVDFKKEIWFASKKINPVIELEVYIKGFAKKQDFNLFRRPLDFLKIGVFDMWVANKDRKPDNPNILISASERFDFHPIDHSAAWAYLSHPKEITISRVHLDQKFIILNVPLTKAIAKFTNDSDLKGLQLEIGKNIQETLQNLDFIFEQVPNEWGFSKNGKARIKEILSDESRNQDLAKRYLSYLK